MIDAFWYRPKDGYNLGDEITTHLLQHLFQQEHVLAPFPKASLLSTGSTLSIAWDRPEHSRRSIPLNVVGSGFMYPANLEIPQYMNVWSVRGHLTRLGLKGAVADKSDLAATIGDPGLLLGLSHIPLDYVKNQRIGYIPHFQKIDSEGTEKVLEKLDAKLIDFRTEDFSHTVSEMLSCDIIVSQALHGLIIADAFRIPNAWYWGGAIHKGGEFKFYDYFSAVGRSFQGVLRGLDDLNDRRIALALHEMKLQDLQRTQSGIMTAFERAISAIHSVESGS